MLSNSNNTVVYTGITNDLKRRIYEHKNKLMEGFTKKYNVDKLVYYEHFTHIEAAIKEKKILKSGIVPGKIS